MTSRYERMHDGMHKIHADDGSVWHVFNALDGGDPHDHPWSFTSEVHYGGYVEAVYDPDTGETVELTRSEGDVFRVDATHVHKIIHLPRGLCITQIRPEQHVQTPGFWRWEGGMAFRRDWNGDWVEQ